METTLAFRLIEIDGEPWYAFPASSLPQVPRPPADESIIDSAAKVLNDAPPGGGGMRPRDMLQRLDAAGVVYFPERTQAQRLALFSSRIARSDRFQKLRRGRYVLRRRVPRVVFDDGMAFELPRAVGR